MRARQGTTVHYWPAKVLEIHPEYMIVEWLGEYEEMCKARVSYDGIKRPDADGQYASGAAGVTSASSSRASTVSRKKAKPAPQVDDWDLHEITAMCVLPAKGLDDRSSIPSRTMLSFTCSFHISGTWVLQVVQEITLTAALADDTTRDLYWCAVLKFMRSLFLTTPTDAVMAGMLGVFEPMCNKEEVEDIGASIKDSDRHVSAYLNGPH